MEIKCRGRNGYFNYCGNRVISGQDTTWVDIHSRSEGKMPPIMMEGKKEDLVKVFQDILKKLELP